MNGFYPYMLLFERASIPGFSLFCQILWQASTIWNDISTTRLTVSWEGNLYTFNYHNQTSLFDCQERVDFCTQQISYKVYTGSFKFPSFKNIIGNNHDVQFNSSSSKYKKDSTLAKQQYILEEKLPDQSLVPWWL